MLSQHVARELGYSGNFNHYKIQSVCFSSNQPLWNKNKSMIKIPKHIMNSSHKYSFHKYGKTLGLETTRYVQYIDGVLFYYDNQDDKEFKGYCKLENLYVYYMKVENKNFMHLTNGIDSTTLHFKNNHFYEDFSLKINKDIIQIGFLQNYTVSQLLGQGTFSKVYLAKKNSDGKIYAAKIIPKVDSTGYHTKAIVQEEKKIMKMFHSDRLCKIYQFYEDTNNFIFVLEYLTGKDLNQMWKANRILTYNQTIYILKEILYCLIEIHKLNIIHRDIKPHNIIVDLTTKSVKLIDFGLSLLYDNNTPLARFMRCGTIGYIAPEVVNNNEMNRKVYDTKSDIFGFGIIVHMLLMGSNPLRGKTYRQTVDKNMRGEASLDRKAIINKYGEKCYDLLASLLAKDPKLRPTAKEAVHNQFLQEKQKDLQTIMNPQSTDERALKYKEDHYNEDKEILGTAASHIIRQNFSPIKNQLTMSKKFSGIN